jgi:hypothetical protein
VGWAGGTGTLVLHVKPLIVNGLVATLGSKMLLNSCNQAVFARF